MSESDLIQSIKDDPSEFSELFRLYYIPIFGYILLRTGNFDETADFAADTFFKAFRHIHAFNYRGISVKVWLYRIATNEANLYFRQQKKYDSIFDRHALGNAAEFKTYFQEDRKEMANKYTKRTYSMPFILQLFLPKFCRFGV